MANNELAKALGVRFCATCDDVLTNINITFVPDMETRDIGRCFFWSCKEPSSNLFHFTDSGTCCAYCKEHLDYFKSTPNREGHEAGTVT